MESKIGIEQLLIGMTMTLQYHFLAFIPKHKKYELRKLYTFDF